MNITADRGGNAAEQAVDPSKTIVDRPFNNDYIEPWFNVKVGSI